MIAKYQDALYTNDDLRPMLGAANNLLVPACPINEDLDYLIIYGRDYDIFVLNPLYQKHARILGQIAVIHPVSHGDFEGGKYDERGT